MAAASKRVLCVDDNLETCQMLEVFLSHAGYDVETAQTFDSGLDLAREKEFDVYLLDLWVEGSAEFDLCKEFRSFDAETPIVIYSADARPVVREKFRDYQAQAFLVKPQGFDKLIETIEVLTD